MNLNELISNNKPLIINGEKVEGTFVKAIPVSKFDDIDNINKIEDRTEKLKLMEKIIKYSLVKEDGTLAVEEGQEIPVAMIDKFTEAIFEANDLSGKSDTEQEESPNT